MKKFSRTVEKILAWIANVFLIVITILIAVVKYSGSFEELLNNPTFRSEFIKSFTSQNPQLSSSDANEVLNMVVPIINGYAVFLIVLSIIALLATFIMSKRILSGVLFILLALAVLVGSMGVGFFIYVPYFVVAIMLFVRKPKNDDLDGFQPLNREGEVEKIEYV